MKFTLTAKDFSHFDNETNTWQQMKGKMVIYIGASSVDIRAKKEVTLK